MKSKFTIVALLLPAYVAMAQANPQTGSPSGQAQGQSTSKPAAPGGAQSQPSSGVNRVPQAKSQEEFTAYKDAAAKTDAAEAAAAADAFAAKFPTSDLREFLYVRAITFYQDKDDAEKEIALGRKAIAINPTDPRPLISVASALAETTRDTDLDRQDRLNEAAKDAQAAIDNIDTGLYVPPNAPPEQVAAVKASILTMAYFTMGKVNIEKNDYPSAEENLLHAVDASKSSPDPSVFLALSIAQDKLKKYPQALENADKAVKYAPDGSGLRNSAKQQQARLQKLIAAGSPPSPATPTTTAPTPAKPATTTQPSNTTPPTTPQ